MEDLILKEHEIKEKLIDLINSSELPAFILKPIIKELYEQLNVLAKSQYEEAVKLKKQKEDE